MRLLLLGVLLLCGAVAGEDRDDDPLRQRARILEAKTTEETPEEQRVAALGELCRVYTELEDVPGVSRTLERLLACGSLIATQRTWCTKSLRQVHSLGELVFLAWSVEALVEEVARKDLDPERRRECVGILCEFCESDVPTELRELRWAALKSVFQVLLVADAETTIEVMRWIRERFPDPKLLRILVHFTYPVAVEQTTPAVRIEALRTIDALGGAAALPTLYACLRDPEPAVHAAVVAALQERRPPPPPFRAWTERLYTDAGAEELAAAFAELRKMFPKGAGPSPVCDHARVFALDPRLPWKAWRAACDFLKANVDPFPSDLPVTEKNRGAITKALADADAAAKAKTVAGEGSPETDGPK